MANKLFFLRDKSGRGYTSNGLNLDDILDMEDDQSRDGDYLSVWAKECETGDVWETAALEIICTDDGTGY